MKRDSDEQPAQVLARTDHRDDYSSSVTGNRMRKLQMTEVVLITNKGWKKKSVYRQIRDFLQSR